MIKYVVIVICLCCSRAIFSQQQEDSPFEHEARTWCTKLLQHNISSEEMTLLLNLLYFSAQRSADIITMQHAATRYISSTAPIMNSVMSARRNPAKISSILNYSTEKWNEKLQQFDAAHAHLRNLLTCYRSNASSYAHCLEYCIKNNGIRAELLLYVHQLRENARQALFATMQAHATSVQSIKNTLKKIMNSFSSEARSLDNGIAEEIQRGIVDCLAHFAAPAAITSFVSLDQKYNHFNEVMWSSLISGYEINTLLWDILEQARFEFYRAHYEALVQNYDHIVIAFNADGYIKPELRSCEKSAHVFI